MASGLREDLVEGSEFRELFEYHRDRIAALFASQPDLDVVRAARFAQAFTFQ